MKPKPLPLPRTEPDPIADTAALAAVCREFRNEDFVTVDTEFIRETTYWPRLCLIQMAGKERAVVVDPLADGLDLSPFFELMADTGVVKVFHAARQDLEIIWNLGQLIPEPVFDTQVAAMVCGYGDSISYDQLVQKVSGAHIDKSSRFTDWARRPLTAKQIDYALSDVTYLRQAYLAISASLAEQDRSEWVAEEMAILTARETYDIRPEDAWKRLKMRVRKPKDIAVMMAVAAWREREAQNRDVPRNRVLKDDGIFEVAMQHPTSAGDLARLRSVPKGFERSRHAAGLLDAVRTGHDTSLDDVPKPKRQPPLPDGTGAVVDLLKVLLKAVSEEDGVAMRIIATVDDLVQIAANDDADVAALKGWRRTLFGNQALKLKHGKLSLRIDGGRVRLVEVD